MTPKRRIISVDLGDLRAPLMAACEASGARPSEAVRNLLANALRGESAPMFDPFGSENWWGRTPTRSAIEPFPARDRPGIYERDIRKITIRLGESEYRLAAALAKREGFAVSRWIAALVRTRLVGGAQLNADEVQALADSNGQLGAIGRNLNQVARALNRQDHRATAYDRQLIEQLSAEIRAHRELVSRLILAATERWQIGWAGKA